MNTIICPRCGTENRASNMNCSSCRINLQFALEHPDQIEAIKGETAPHVMFMQHAGNLMNAQRHSLGCLSGLLWGLATLFGLVIAPLVVWPVTAGLGWWGAAPDSPVWLIESVISALSLGLVIALAQWYALRFHVRSAWAWIGLTVLGLLIAERIGASVGLGWFNGGYTLATRLGRAVILGVVLGAAQWFALIGRIDQPARWITVSLVGWGAAGLLGEIFAGEYLIGPLLWLLCLLFGGAIFPPLVMLWLLNRPALRPGMSGRIIEIGGALMSGLIALIAYIVALSYMLWESAATPATPPVPSVTLSPPTGRIAFISDREPYGVYIMNADGSDPIFVGEAMSYSIPRWSPDGTQLLLESRREGHGFVVDVVNSDGSNLAFVHDGSSPFWSPDGTRIVFVYYPVDNGEIYTIDVDGSILSRLTTSPADDWRPTWSPDGQWIAFVSFKDDEYDIKIIKADGTGLAHLAQSVAGLPRLGWSPDGQRIAFATYEGLQVVGADGSNRMTLTTGATPLSEPAWSPDGTRIVFTCPGEEPHETHHDICIIDADGRNLQRLTGNFPAESSESDPSWSPDGEWIAFCGRLITPHVFKVDVYIMTSYGTQQTNLTDSNPKGDCSPTWMP